MRFRKYFILLMIFLLTSIGFSSWIIVGSKEEKLGESPVTTPVCYINDNSDGYQYTRIEKALEVAVSGDTVYVVPGTNPTIYKDCEIKNGVTLCVPYLDKMWNEKKSSVGLKVYSDFADKNSETVATNLKSNVFVKPMVNITINGGTLQIGGIVDDPTQVPAGHTSGSYSQITMGLYSSINVINNGSIYCNGYIKEDYGNITPNTKVGNGSYIELNGSILYAPFVVYDYKGGSNTVGIFKGSPDAVGDTVTPFNVFDMPNIQTKMKINDTSVVYGLADLFTDQTEILGTTLEAQHNATTIKMIGRSDAVINLKQGTTLISKYAAESHLYGNTIYKNATGNSPTSKTEAKSCATNNGINCNHCTNVSKTTITISGAGASLGSMKLIVSVPILGEQNVNTDVVLFPISYKLEIVLEKGTFEFGNRIKFLPGSSLTVGKEAVLNVNSDCIIYDDSLYNMTHEYYPVGKDEAKFIVDGTLNINSGATFGGTVVAGEKDAMLSVGVDSATDLEVKSYEGTGARDTLTFTFTSKYTSHQYLNGKVGSATNDNQNLGTTVYLSSGLGYWSEVTFNFNITYMIKYDDDAPQTLSINNPATAKIKEGLTISVDPTVDDTKGQVFVGWFYDLDCNNLIIDNYATGANLYKYSTDNSDTVRNITIYALVTTLDPIIVSYLDGQNSVVATVNAYPGIPFSIPMVIPTKNTTESSDYIIEYTFKEWIYSSNITINGDGTATLSRDISETSLDIKSQFDSKYYWALIVSESTSYATSLYLKSSSFEGYNGTTEISGNGTYYIAYNTKVSITISCGYGLTTQTSKCEISGALSNFDGTTNNYITVSGRKDQTVTGSFTMPNGVVNLKISH